MENRLIISDRIATLLSLFGRKIQILSTNNELAWNKLAENIVVPLLNLAFNLELKNINVETHKQFVAIDLIDKSNRVAFQVTSDDSFGKIKTTLHKFKDNRLYNDIGAIKFLYLKEKGRRTLTANQEEELKTLINSQFSFSYIDSLFDFSKLYSLLQEKDIDDLERVLSGLEMELGKISDDLLNKKLIATIIFDEDNELELADKVVKGLIELGIRVRHFSPKLDYSHRKANIYSSNCQLLFDISTESKFVITLCSITLKSKIQQKIVEEIILKTLDNPHNVQCLFKLEEEVSLSDITWYKPKVFKSNRTHFQYIIDTISLELQKQSRVSIIKGYDDFEIIIRLYESKAKFTAPVNHSDSKSGIGYTLLETTDKLKHSKTYYLYLYAGIYIKPTAKHFFTEYKEVKQKTNDLIVLLPKETNQKQLDDRIGSVKRAFKTSKVFYLDEFVWEHCTTEDHKPSEQIKFSITKNFIVPELKPIEGSLNDFDQIDNWLTSEHDPILIITGGGGIGKTTMAKVIADKFQTIRTNSRVIFIEASDVLIMNHLLRISEKGQIDLYDFYSATFPYDTLSRDLFRINIDNGNFLLIIDGLDEVFSRIPDFNVRHFIASVSTDFVKDIGVGKILLTCRSYFWKERISQDTHINHFEIKPFSRKHARQFFEQKFNYNEREIKKALSIVESLNPDTSEDKDKIMPYIVDVVGKIVESGDELLEEEIADVPYLNLKLKNDYVIYRLLKREEMKTGQLSIVLQINFFLTYSVFYGGKVASTELKNIWNTHFDTTLTSTMEQALKSHPLLEELNDTLVFKYDFFEIFFKGVYLSEFIAPENSESPNDNLIKILLNEGKYGSSLFYETTNRTYKFWNDDYYLRISLIIDYLQRELVHNESYNIKSVHHATSSIFALALMIHQQRFNNQTSTNTELMIDVFGKKNNEIHNFSIVNFSESQGNIKFNFSNLKFFNCYFESFESFWDCTFNHTYFENCSFFNMPSYSSSNSKDIKLDFFVNSRKDSTFDDYFEWLGDQEISKKEEVKYVLEKFFKLFYSNGYLQVQKVDSILRKRYNPKWTKVIPFDILIKSLQHLEILEIKFNKVSKEQRAEIKEKFKEDIIQFTKEGTMSATIISVLNLLLRE
ncbi:MAG: SMEK domain-containing protein [Sediminicola sp.]